MSQINEISHVLFDYGRSARIGLPEAVYGEGKPLPTLIGLMEKFADGNPPILFTRLHPDVVARVPADVLKYYNYDPLSRTAYAARLERVSSRSVAIVSAGSADSQVAHECARTLEYLNIKFTLFEDCGVSALWRVCQNIAKINTHDAVVVVAGMEGALASVVGGLCPRPIFAVPTSIGYGVGSNGRAALAGMLASCAPGIAVLNIDNGYGAACAAARVVGLQ